MRFLINFTSRSRPLNFFRGIKSIKDNFSSENEYRIVAVLDSDDTTMNTKHIIGCMEDEGVEYYFGKSSGKISAINRETDKFGDDWDVLINFSDDMVITAKDFDKSIAEKIGDDTDKYLHFRDSNHKVIDALCTLHIVGREYFNRDGFIYHPDFISVWCDNFNDDLAKARNKYYFYDEIIFNHIHPAYGKAVKDEQYAKTEDRRVYAKDHKTYRQMKKQLDKYI